MPQCKVISIANQKGGVGKTTIALNLDVVFVTVKTNYAFANFNSVII